MSCRRLLRYGQRVKIIEYRFGYVGSFEPTGTSYGWISKKLYITPATVITVCHAYLRNNGWLRGPGEHQCKGRRKLSAA